MVPFQIGQGGAQASQGGAYETNRIFFIEENFGMEGVGVGQSRSQGHGTFGSGECLAQGLVADQPARRRGKTDHPEIDQRATGRSDSSLETAAWAVSLFHQLLSASGEVFGGCSFAVCF